MLYLYLINEQQTAVPDQCTTENLSNPIPTHPPLILLIGCGRAH